MKLYLAIMFTPSMIQDIDNEPVITKWSTISEEQALNFIRNEHSTVVVSHSEKLMDSLAKLGITDAETWGFEIENYFSIDFSVDKLIVIQRFTPYVRNKRVEFVNYRLCEGEIMGEDLVKQYEEQQNLKVVESQETPNEVIVEEE